MKQGGAYSQKDGLISGNTNIVTRPGMGHENVIRECDTDIQIESCVIGWDNNHVYFVFLHQILIAYATI